MQLTIKGLKGVGELAACAVIAWIWLELCAGSLWEAGYLLGAASLWFFFGRSIKRPQVRKLAGAAAVVATLTLDYFLAVWVSP